MDLWLFFLGNKLRNTERRQHRRIKDDSSVLWERIGDQAADRRLSVSSPRSLGKQWCPAALHGTPSAYTSQPGSLSDHRLQPAELRLQDRRPQKMPARLLGSPWDQRGRSSC